LESSPFESPFLEKGDYSNNPVSDISFLGAIHELPLHDTPSACGGESSLAARISGMTKNIKNIADSASYLLILHQDLKTISYIILYFY